MTGIGQLHSVVLDAPGDDRVVVTGARYRLGFQQASDHVPPDRPDPARPQQFHLDVRVGDA